MQNVILSPTTDLEHFVDTSSQYINWSIDPRNYHET